MERMTSNQARQHIHDMQDIWDARTSYRLIAHHPNGQQGHTPHYGLTVIHMVAQELHERGFTITDILRCDEYGHMVLDQSHLPDIQALLDAPETELTAEAVTEAFRQAVRR